MFHWGLRVAPPQDIIASLCCRLDGASRTGLMDSASWRDPLSSVNSRPHHVLPSSTTPTVGKDDITQWEQRHREQLRRQKLDNPGFSQVSQPSL